jgi:putative endonuclease
VSEERPHFVYIIECADGSYYIGSARDVAGRVQAHNAGKAATWTASRRPVVLVYEEKHPDETSALQREKHIKRWTHAKKEALIARNKALLKMLSKRNRRERPSADGV